MSLYYEEQKHVMMTHTSSYFMNCDQDEPGLSFNGGGGYQNAMVSTSCYMSNNGSTNIGDISTRIDPDFQQWKSCSQDNGDCSKMITPSNPDLKSTSGISGYSTSLDNPLWSSTERVSCNVSVESPTWMPSPRMFGVIPDLSGNAATGPDQSGIAATGILYANPAMSQPWLNEIDSTSSKMTGLGISSMAAGLTTSTNSYPFTESDTSDPRLACPENAGIGLMSTRDSLSTAYNIDTKAPYHRKGTDRSLNVYSMQFSESHEETLVHQSKNSFFKSSRRQYAERTRYSTEQIEKLEHEFEKNNFPPFNTCELIAKEFKCKSRNIEIWFKNRRAKKKRGASRGQKRRKCDKMNAEHMFSKYWIDQEKLNGDLLVKHTD